MVRLRAATGYQIVAGSVCTALSIAFEGSVLAVEWHLSLLVVNLHYHDYIAEKSSLQSWPERSHL